MFFDASAFNDLKRTAEETNPFDPLAPDVNPPENEGFFKQAADAFRYQRASGNTTSGSDMFWAEMEKDWSAIQEERKKAGFNPFEKGTIIEPRAYSKGIASDDFGREYEELRARYPQAAARPFEEIRKAVAEKVESLRLETEVGSKGILSKAGGFMGTMAGAMTDPVNIAFMLAGAPPGAGLGRVLLTEAAGGVASELIVQRQVRKFNESIGNEYGLKDQAEAVAMAAGGAVAIPVIGKGVKGLYGYVRRLAKEKGASLPIRATDRSFAEKEFIDGSNPYEKSDVVGEGIHERDLETAKQQILEGEPVQDSVKVLTYIDEGTAAVIGKRPGVLQLKEANTHPSERHLAQIQSVGFKGVEDFSEFVAQNYDAVYRDLKNPGRFLFVVSNEKLKKLGKEAGKHTDCLVAETLIIEKAGIYDIVSALPKKEKDLKQKRFKNLFSGGMPNRHLTEPDPEPLTRQKQAYKNNIVYDGKNVQTVNVDDYKLTTRYEVVDLDELKTSDAADYPAELQPRDRSRQASADQVGEISRNLDPERLGRHTDADRGAPIVSPEGFVESGNGRTMAIRKAYAENPAAAARYKKMVEAEAKALGVDVSGMKNPVLIRRRLTDLTPEERLSFVEAANRSTSLAYSISEKAAIDAQRLDGELLDLFQGGDLTAAKNAEFVRQFRKAAVSKEEVAGFVTSNGTLSRAGEERIQAALFAKAYGDRELAGLLFENESNIKSIGRALMDAAAEFAKLKEDIKAGIVATEYDITQSIIDAVNLVRSARAAGETVADAVNQLDLFAPDNGRLTGILKTFFRDENFKRPVSAEKTAEALKRYARAARNQRKDQLSMFDVSSTPDEILGEGFSKIKAEDAINGSNAKEAADVLAAEEAVEQVRIDREMEKVDAEVGTINDPFAKDVLEAAADDAGFADRMLQEATTCRF